MQRLVEQSYKILPGIVLQGVNAYNCSVKGNPPSQTAPGNVTDCISGWAEFQLKLVRLQSVCVWICNSKLPHTLPGHFKKLCTQKLGSLHPNLNPFLLIIILLLKII